MAAGTPGNRRTCLLDATGAVTAATGTFAGGGSENMMPIPHWLIGLAIFGGLAAFVGFAFGQGLKVKPDRNKNPDEWAATAARHRTARRRQVMANPAEDLCLRAGPIPAYSVRCPNCGHLSGMGSMPC